MPAAAPLLAKTMAEKPHTPFRIVTSDGRTVMYFNLCLRTRRSKLSLAAWVFNRVISIKSKIKNKKSKL
jgi:hypothetical protein